MPQLEHNHFQALQQCFPELLPGVDTLRGLYYLEHPEKLLPKENEVILRPEGYLFYLLPLPERRGLAFRLCQQLLAELCDYFPSNERLPDLCRIVVGAFAQEEPDWTSEEGAKFFRMIASYCTVFSDAMKILQMYDNDAKRRGARAADYLSPRWHAVCVLVRNGKHELEDFETFVMPSNELRQRFLVALRPLLVQSLAQVEGYCAREEESLAITA